MIEHPLVIHFADDLAVSGEGGAEVARGQLNCLRSRELEAGAFKAFTCLRQGTAVTAVDRHHLIADVLVESIGAFGNLLQELLKTGAGAGGNPYSRRVWRERISVNKMS